MGRYKVPQDVEAEDKLVGPFSLKQFVFLCVVALFGFIIWFLAIRLGQIWAWVLILPAIPFLVLGVWQRDDQPVETYLLALINFHLKPHARIWSNERVVEGVRMLAPELKPQPVTPDARQVAGQLKRLSMIVDTRGWSDKNGSLQEPSEGGQLTQEGRLAGQSDLPELRSQPFAGEEVPAGADVFDAANPIGQNLAGLAESANQQQMQQAQQQMAQPQQATPTYNPYPVQQSSQNAYAQPVTTTPDPAILQLSQNNDLSVSSIAAVAQYKRDGNQQPNNQTPYATQQSAQPAANSPTYGQPNR